jgi:hypothetical protein
MGFASSAVCFNGRATLGERWPFRLRATALPPRRHASGAAMGGISGEFSSIPVTRKRYRDNRDAQFASENGQKPSRA